MQLPKIYAQKVPKRCIDLTLSENPLGCSPAVEKVLKNLTAKDISSYPSQSNLIKAISQRFSVKTENILLGCGSEQLIKLIVQTIIRPGDSVLIQTSSFPLFTKECIIAGAKIKQSSVSKIKGSPKPKLVFLCNPNNPTGEVLTNKTIASIVQKMAPSVIVVDEASGEFMNNSFISQAVKSSNCIVIKTFSKAMGLAGLRIGFAVGPQKLISKLASVQQPFPVSTIASKLAIAALSDEAFISKTKKFISNERKFLTSELKKRSLTVSKSVTNNLFITSTSAKALIKELERQKISVVSSSFFPNTKRSGFRISIKDKKTNRKFLNGLDKALVCLNKRN